jgi:hypothetical protein
LEKLDGKVDGIAKGLSALEARVASHDTWIQARKEADQERRGVSDQTIAELKAVDAKTDERVRRLELTMQWGFGAIAVITTILSIFGGRISAALFGQ